MLYPFVRRVIILIRQIIAQFRLYISCVGKVMERVVYKHVYNHLQSLKLIWEFQSGFLPKHSTVHQLLEMYNLILNWLERKEMSCFVFCDFLKAFDKVWHRGLLHKLKAYGINVNLLDWFHHYLNERKQRVVFKDASSSLTTILGGVLQDQFSALYCL